IADTVDAPADSHSYIPKYVVWTGFLVLQIVNSLVFTPAFFGVYVLRALLFLGRLLIRVGAPRR
ncbi:MAG: hypothetical protein IBJ15_21555, partial [Alphaproteobacteria bacterium]|nr:hypothetical protein [Alphaproteobacteria bacterium]